MQQTTQADLVGGEALQKAIDSAVFNNAVDATGVAVKSQENREKPRPAGNGGTPVPSGRPKGVRNKLTNLRDAVLEAFDQVGGAQYLVQLAKGTQSDRAAFTSLVAKVLPTQINQQVDGGIRLELTWLGGRQIGATQAQIESQHTQALDLERDSEGKYRIKDQAHPSAGGDGQGAAGGDGTNPDAINGAKGA